MPPRPYQPGECLRIRDERWRVARADIVDDETIVDVVGCDVLNAGAHALFLAGAEQVERLPANASPRLVRPSRWRTIARHRLSGVTPRFASLRAAAAADVTIIPFQLEPALALTHGLGRRLLIADEVGLGKTVQAGLVIAEALARVSEGHALVVAPAALRQQWLEELQQRFHLPAVMLDAATIARAVTVLGTGANPWAAYPVVVVSIDYIKRAEVMHALEALVWDVVVFDEAHVLAGLSERAAAAHQLGARARALVSLTATPHSGDQDAFDRLTTLGRLGDAAPLLLFRRSRRDVGLPSTRRSRWFAVRSTDAELEMHRALLQYARTVCRQRHAGSTPARLAMSILLKRGCSSASSLARSVERRLSLIAATSTPQDANQLDLPFDTGDDQEPLAELGTPGLIDRGAEEEMLSLLLAAARKAAADERKINALRRLLRRRAEPAIVFTEYRDTLEHIARQLTGHRIAIVHGGLTPSERRVALDQFTRGSADVLLATDAASEGLNLQRRCRRVVNMELPWTPVRLEQRIGRVDRIGQRQIVHATHLIARDTVENDIVARLLSRLTTADTSLAGVAARDEDDIVSAVTATPRENAALAPPRPARDVAAIVVPDLREAARQEAAQLLMSRALATPGRDSVDGRPVITRIRRSGSARCVWAMRLSFADSRAHVCWSTLVGVTAPTQRISDLRRALDGQLGADFLQVYLTALTRVLIGGAVPFASSAIAREDAILASLHATRAHLVPRERGLFDRRDERASAAQVAILAEAVSRCERQRLQLASLQRLTLNSCELAFAVAIE